MYVSGAAYNILSLFNMLKYLRIILYSPGFQATTAYDLDLMTFDLWSQKLISTANPNTSVAKIV